MAALLDIFSFLSVLLRGIILAFEALTVGGVVFLFAIARQAPKQKVSQRLARLIAVFAAMLAIAQLASMGANAAVLMTSANLTWAEVRGAGFCLAGAAMVLGAIAVGGFAHARWATFVCPIGCALILAGSVMTSHAAARLEHRTALAFLTLVHHVAGAVWIGGLPFLLWTLRWTQERAAAEFIVSRFSRMAMTSVVLLAGAGLAMALLYVGDASALIGTTYGIMLSSKVTMTALLLLLGGLNLRIIRAVRTGAPADLLPLRRFSEAEVGIGFTIILTAASLTSTPPAIDVRGDRMAIPEIVERMKPGWPRLETPPLADLSPATPLDNPPLKPSTPGSFVPGQSAQPGTPADIAWSEYNHHWAGIVVLAAGVLSLLARRLSWARHWPLAFLGLAVFLFLRADSENWPLGPRGFWESFRVAEVAQHRLFVVLIVAFAIFEWAVQTGRLRTERAGLIFPLVCAVGGALLLTHSHSLGNVKEEFLAELSHIPLAILGVLAGWSRWLELRLAPNPHRVLKWIWPVCFILIGGILLNYREA